MREFDHEVATLQGRVAVISFAGPVQLKRFAERSEHPFLWLADPDRVSYKRLGIGRRGVSAIAPPRVIWGYVRFALQGKVWHPEQLDVAQMGGDFVFDRAGNLALKHISTASDDRPSAEAIILALRTAAGSTGGADER